MPATGQGWIDGIRGVLLDVDGTLLDGERAVPGAGEALLQLRQAGIPFRLTTNTTRHPRSAIVGALARAGIEARREEILIPASLAARRIVESGRTRTALLVPEACVEDLHGILLDERNPDWVIVGDMGRAFTFERMNQAFLWLRGGASLLALQRGRYWRPGPGQIVLDAGPFVAALEYAAGVRAELVGKPARPFFDLAVSDLGLPSGQVLVVGDDVENDVAGGAGAGLRTALVKTGKHGECPERPLVAPDLELNSIADLSPPAGGPA
jgi:HAD superfamily hydrolase (TIGR01458 family)